MNLGIGTMGLMLLVVVGGWAWRRREKDIVLDWA
jgi:LPXTG-motif cell wall-anchored protein